MWKWPLWYFAAEAIFVVGAVLTTLWLRHRRNQFRQLIPPGFVRTDETFIDPTNGAQMRVWYHPGTGERRYERVENPSAR
ncbi:hypothetical protein [Alicyclobacillus acidiphilus]|uniref:hypothetical protein n=1 Tax=Alicyclobacillus acidiphilus TaxID=182455 RepID=UPI000835B257|nr:hypothetical protein [Alicyclobacillus acidiphilus]